MTFSHDQNDKYDVAACHVQRYLLLVTGSDRRELSKNGDWS